MGLAGNAIAPSIISAAAALGGVLMTGLFSLVVMWRRNVREDRHRFSDAARLAYVELFAGFDYWPDAAEARRALQQDHAQGALTDATYDAKVSRFDELDRLANERVTTAIAAVDLLAPQDVCDLATAAYEVCELDIEDPDRVAAMEALVTATRQHLNIKPSRWKQKLSSGAG